MKRSDDLYVRRTRESLQAELAQVRAELEEARQHEDDATVQWERWAGVAGKAQAQLNDLLAAVVEHEKARADIGFPGNQRLYAVARRIRVLSSLDTSTLRILIEGTPPYDAIVKERFRQDKLKAEGRFKWTAADEDCPPEVRLGMLVEEVGEVSRAMQDGHDAGDLRTELVQVCAIGVAWLEFLEATGDET